MAESADAHGSEPCTRKGVWVQLPLAAFYPLVVQWIEHRFPEPAMKVRFLPGGISGYSAVWLARTLGVGEAGSSNLPSPIKLMLIDGHFLLN